MQDEMTIEREEITSAPQPKNGRKKRDVKSFYEKKKFRQNVFVICMLAYPVLQFLVMWAFVNVDSIAMTFERYNDGWEFAGLQNYRTWISYIQHDPIYVDMLVNSVLHSVVGMFVIFPLCLMMSYFLCRKVPLSGFFRIVFYLPSIIPLVVLALGFRNMISMDGLLGKMYLANGSTPPDLLNPPAERWTVYLFTTWAGLGGNLLLLSGTIKRVPTEVLESARLDGLGTMGELWRIVVPMIWPTLVTLFVMSMMGVFTVVFQPYFLIDDMPFDIMTIGLFIFQSSGDYSSMAMAATLGIMTTILIAPIVLLTRWGLDKLFADIDY